nr:GtrA family protein [Lachnospiraceae bacterium]
MKKILQRLLNRETVTYLIFGVLTTAVNFVVYDGLLRLGVNYLIANVIAWIAAVLFAYFTNKHFVFQSRDYHLRTVLPEMARFAAGRLITLGIEQALLYTGVDLLKGNERVIKLLAAVIVVILNYVFSKLFIFKNQKDEKEDPDEN